MDGKSLLGTQWPISHICPQQEKCLKAVHSAVAVCEPIFSRSWTLFPVPCLSQTYTCMLGFSSVWHRREQLCSLDLSPCLPTWTLTLPLTWVDVLSWALTATCLRTHAPALPIPACQLSPPSSPGSSSPTQFCDLTPTISWVQVQVTRGLEFRPGKNTVWGAKSQEKAQIVMSQEQRPVWALQQSKLWGKMSCLNEKKVQVRRTWAINYGTDMRLCPCNSADLASICLLIFSTLWKIIYEYFYLYLSFWGVICSCGSKFKDIKSTALNKIPFPFSIPERTKVINFFIFF